MTLQWYEGELEKPLLLSKARALVDATECITKAPEKVEAKAEAEAQKAREEAVPVYLKDRVKMGGALTVVELVGQTVQKQVEEEKVEEERRAVCELVVNSLARDLFLELMEGLRYR